MSRRRIKATLAVGFATALLSSPISAAPQDPLAPTGRWSAYTAGRAETPPMGWSTWNAFATDIDEEKIIGSAQRIVDTGLAAKGYRYINIDDGWALKRRMPDGRMIVRTDKFPSADVKGDDAPNFRPFTDRLHAMGLKAGIYSDLGRNTCSEAWSLTDTDLPKGNVLEREVGLHGRIDQDIALYFAKWGFDFIKVDGCGLRDYGTDSARVRSGKFRALGPILDSGAVTRTDIPAVQALFRQINVALARENPDGDYLLSLCVWGAANVRAWGKDYGGISRTSDDISPAWGRLLVNYDTTVTRSLYAHPGSWNDPDMLHIGAGDFDADHLTEARSHFALWAMLNAPLMIGTDLRKTPKALLDIFGNADIIAIDQDPAGNQATLAYDSSDLQILVKTLASGDKALAIFNRGSGDYDVDLNASHLKFDDSAPIELVDLWTRQKTSFAKTTRLHVKPRETLIFRARGTRLLQGGYYLSEQPGTVNPAVDGVVKPTADPTIFRTAAGWAGTNGAGDRPSYAGWGGARADSAPYGQILHVAGKPFAAGIGILANSRMEVRNRGATRFTSMVGVDDSATDKRGSVTFLVYGDGKLLATSSPLKWGTPAQRLSASVTGTKVIELVVRGASADNQQMPVTWGEAALLER
ncbi:NPCBM/NEW2 domain-containing protein [Sphingomonas sp. QA11]|uniref:NPCBM/NEW2 domain-containing protein n=1 Tax=Sphingomonas sp. QA11 TaxID=2950605 RepID=UPI00234914DE|nr:NPCBM/NEW2 domain-containing protein [Sphingomonas sp. QA11]WCM29762.1 NPCBM/NEW2 domain-containing protein [Sphingomonas sp. QA11]